MGDEGLKVKRIISTNTNLAGDGDYTLVYVITMVIELEHIDEQESGQDIALA